MLPNLRRLVGVNWKIASAVLFFVWVILMIPQITPATKILSNLIAYGLIGHNSNTSITNQPVQKLSSQPGAIANSPTEYIPPNYGAPDSEYASGTR